MLERIYYWLHREISKNPEEKDAPSAGWLHSKVRQEVENLCLVCQGKLLEVGCGEGLFITKLASINSAIQIFGVDNDIKKLQDAKSKSEEKRLGNIKLIYADAINLPFPDDYFDGVVCINTFVNLKSILIVNQVLEQMARVCKKKGKIFFDFRNSLNLFINL